MAEQVVDVAPIPQEQEQARARPSVWQITSPTTLLAILALINFLNYVDRYVLGALVPFLEAGHDKGGLGLTPSQIGLLQAAFMVVHSVASIPLGVVADRWMRKWLISIGVSVWSVATAAAGFARNFSQIFVARGAVGIGEATYAPAASALISERFDAAQRARALGVFQVGMVLGGAIGMVAGGVVATHFGWRAAFWVVGAPGLLLSILILFVRETRREREASASASMQLQETADGPRSIPALVWINSAGIFITFFTGALGIWALEYILRVRYGGNPAMMKRVVFSFGPITVIAGVLGVLAGSLVADRLEKAKPGAGRLITIAIGVFASAPCAVVGFLAHDAVLQYGALGLGVFFNVWYVGPILAVLHDVVPPRFRATATGAYLCLVHALGDGISPWIVGQIEQRTGSLRNGLLVATAVLALGGFAAWQPCQARSG